MTGVTTTDVVTIGAEMLEEGVETMGVVVPTLMGEELGELLVLITTGVGVALLLLTVAEETIELLVAVPFPTLGLAFPPFAVEPSMPIGKKAERFGS